MSAREITSLHYYPIKSCAPVRATEVTFTETGIAHDRERMLVGERGQFLSQRVHPELALVQTDLQDDKLIVQAPRVGALAIPLEQDPDAEEIAINLFKKPGSGLLAGSEVNEYFSDYLGRNARLIRVQQPRTIKPECQVEGYSTRTAFADGFPLLLTSSNSLTELNNHLERPVPMGRFRPNIVVEGAEPYAEDCWRKVQVGDLQAFVVRACARCSIPNIHLQAGVLPKERPVTDALRATRYGIDPVSGTKEVFFGQNLVHVPEPGVVVRVGDPVTVVESSFDPNWYPIQEAK